MTYEEKLLHPKWQKKKAEILARDNHTCRSCGATEITLHAHHLFYIKDTDPWDYKDDSLITYCEICHNTEHLIGNVLRDYLVELIKENPPLIHMVSQLCVLSEKLPEFEPKLRSFLKDEMTRYYQHKKTERDA